jgi:hypothetical protein
MKIRPKTFDEVAAEQIAFAEHRVAMGDRSGTLARDYRHRHRCHAQPFMGSMSIDKIDAMLLEKFRIWMAQKGLKNSAILPVESFVRGVLRRAARQQLIAYVPEFPERNTKASPRPAFRRSDYLTLLETLKKVEDGKPAIAFKGNVVDWELRALVTFMVNSFTRPGDVFAIQNKHMEIVDAGDGPAYLRLNAPSSKGHDAPIITMPVAVKIYQRSLDRHRKAGFGKPDDYVFLPRHRSRAYAHEVVRRQFRQVLIHAGMLTSAKGVEHTLYSLRHTAIVFRLLNAKDLDLLTLARTCRTSVEMLDRYYASSLTAEMNRDKLHSFRRPSRHAA